jgi:hypothetical protein
LLKVVIVNDRLKTNARVKVTYKSTWSPDRLLRLRDLPAAHRDSGQLAAAHQVAVALARVGAAGEQRAGIRRQVLHREVHAAELATLDGKVARLRKRDVSWLAELNAAIRELLADLSSRRPIGGARHIRGRLGVHRSPNAASRRLDVHDLDPWVVALTHGCK